MPLFSVAAWGLAIAGMVAWQRYSSKTQNQVIFSDAERDALNAKRKAETASQT